VTARHPLRRESELSGTNPAEDATVPALERKRLDEIAVFHPGLDDPDKA